MSAVAHWSCWGWRGDRTSLWRKLVLRRPERGWQVEEARAWAGATGELSYWDCWGSHGEMEHVNNPVPNSTPEAAMDELLSKARFVSGVLGSSASCSGSGTGRGERRQAHSHFG